MLALDATTRSEYDAEATAADAAQAVVDALGATVYVKVYDGAGTVKASGTMGSPWATQAAGVITIGEVSSFSITAAGAVDPTWYLRFEGGSRWVHGSFGLRGSGADFELSSDAWINGYSIRLGTVRLNAPSNAAPSLAGAGTSLTLLAGAGGYYDFGNYATDPDGDVLTFTLFGGVTGISIDASSGLLTVTTTVGAGTYPLTVRVSDPAGLSSDLPFTVTIGEDVLIRFAPGHYFRPGLSDSLASIQSKIASYDDRVKGLTLFRYWKDIETSKGVYDWSFFDAVFTTAKQYNKRVILRIQDRIFNQTNPALAVPQYIIDEGLSYVTTGTPRAGTALWLQAAMDYSIAVYTAALTRYGSQVCADGDPVLVATYGEESIFAGVDDLYPSYSPSALVTQELRRAFALRTAFPNIPYFWLTNWITPHSTHSSGTYTTDAASHAAMLTWFSDACRVDPGIFTSYGPDTRFINGVQIDGWDAIRGTFGGVDHRGDYAVIGWTEALEWNAGSTAAQIYAGAVTQGTAAIMVWSTNPAQWASEAYPYIATHATDETIPTRLVGRAQVI